MRKTRTTRITRGWAISALLGCALWLSAACDPPPESGSNEEPPSQEALKVQNRCGVWDRPPGPLICLDDELLLGFRNINGMCVWRCCPPNGNGTYDCRPPRRILSAVEGAAAQVVGARADQLD
jgi:hypothetical protein